MHESVLKQCLKHLESNGYIRDMKSVENPNKKMYIKATLRPSERATGGPWYTDSSLDEAFIADLERLVFDTVKNRSSYLSTHSGSGTTRQPKKGVIRGGDTTNSPAAATVLNKAKKRSVDDEDNNMLPPTTSGALRRGRPRHHYRETLLPLPAGYTDYPTVRQIAEIIERSGVTNNTTLGEADIQQLVDVLVYDGLLEPVRLPQSRHTGYRAVNVSRLDPRPMTVATIMEDGGDSRSRPMGAPLLDNGFTESPCGLCPVFDLCEEGGPVNPANCVYYSRWLGLETTPLSENAVSATME